MRTARAVLVGMTLAGLAGAALAGAVSAQTPGLPPEFGRGTDQDIRQWFSCRTRMTYMPVHGTQVTYSRSDGTVLLWYPGNTVVLPGKWELRSGNPTPSMCFYYFTQGLNPATGLPGTTWQCMPATFLVRTTVESAKGDVFALSRRRAVPFVLARAKTTMAELQELTHRLAAKLERPEHPDVGCEMKTSSLRQLSTVTD